MLQMSTSVLEASSSANPSQSAPAIAALSWTINTGKTFALIMRFSAPEDGSQPAESAIDRYGDRDRTLQDGVSFVISDVRRSFTSLTRLVAALNGFLLFASVI